MKYADGEIEKVIPRVKITGITKPEEAEVLNAVMPEYAGFVFEQKSAETAVVKKTETASSGKSSIIDPATAAEIRKLLNPKIRTIGIFADEEPEKIVEVVKTGCISMIELDGNETDAYVMKLRFAIEHAKLEHLYPIIKAFRVETAADVSRAESSLADMIVFDSGRDEKCGGDGDNDAAANDNGAGKGRGNDFDWGIISEIGRNYFLTGGLNAENVTDAIEKTNPFAVDIQIHSDASAEEETARLKKFAEVARAERD